MMDTTGTKIIRQASSLLDDAAGQWGEATDGAFVDEHIASAVRQSIKSAKALIKKFENRMNEAMK